MTTAPEGGRPHGDHNTYVHGNCRCAECTAAATEYNADLRVQLRKRLASGVDNVEHGNASTYRNHGCRCPKCTAANTEKARLYRQSHARKRRKP
jgi:hypothetical protein